MLYFEKYEANGNDFIIVNEIVDKAVIPKICDRHFGVGSDGFIIVRNENNTFYMDYYNADGSRASLCGNGLRCVGKYLQKNKLIDSNTFTVKTEVGDKVGFINPDGSITINLGKPIIKYLNEEVRIENRIFLVALVELGVWHGVIYLGNLDEELMYKYAPLLSKHPQYSSHINVNFCEIISKDHIKIVTYERGVGFTNACGTGACCSYIVGKTLYNLNNQVKIIFKGGEAFIEEKADGIYLTGKAKFICRGYYEREEEQNA